MCVPWPLRMLVTDALQIPLEVAHLWLSKLKNRTIDPDSLQPPFCPYPAPYNLSSTPVSTSLNGHHPSKPPFKTEDQVLQECRLRSVVTASETAEPQAALHLAIHFELHHKHLARQQFGKHQDAVTQFCHAYDYYLAAAKLGSVPALVHVARLQSRALHFHWQYVEISPTPTVESVLALLLAAAFQGSVQAFQALPRVMDDGVFNALKPFEPSLDTRAAKSGRSFAEQNCVIERELFNVTYRVALDLRVGTKHLPQREDLAVALLHIAHRRRHSRSSLELGLYMVQTARSFEEARAGMDILSKLTNTDAHEGLQACFRLGRWLYYGLPHEFACSNGRITASTQHSNRQQGRQRQENMDHDQATCLVKTAAEGGLREAMVLYGTLLKKWAARHPDQGYLDEGNYWIKKAGTCPMAYYAKALLLIYEAESSFKPRCKMTGAESFGSTTSGSNPGTSNASSANMSSSTPSRIGSKKSKKRGEKKKLLKWLQNSSSGALEVIEKPNRSTLSAETLTQDASQIEDNAMNKAIQKKFEKVYNILVDGPAALAKDFPGENLNPYPYYKAAEFMIGFGYIWADCDPSKTEAGLKEEARILLKKVTEIPRSHDPTTWEHLRRNWRQEDMFYVRKARDLETKMFK
ncbi:hypothetical protein BWQ96_06204 [Gracilariopsis chorda]|uniref:Uncharacterized protein n=1 Tax=Gracilariopsis chorda TaxID=448386 RepID=A0A2V3IPL7_9FLOR|nr:hypothetical protein BWQ96_06204 [Gracilariopsis chorda]|eukprot:PXF44031.1 hypothetical protein BWQ96_06204 [Gracilariopsis chorda]